mgnify:CR=1 FL=1
MNDLLVANSVSKNFGKFKALNEVSIAVPKGSIFGLLGPNGAGKTTLIRIINQITMPDSGTVHLDGQPLKAESMKVGEQCLYLAQLKGLSKTEARKRLKYWFEKLEIGDWWNKKIQELSKGQAQKIQFIVTVLHQPKLLIFDEPFSGFDPINANLIKDEILQLREEGATVIFSTHRMESVEELCDHIALIHKSNKILDGKLNDIKRQNKTNTFQVGLESLDKDRVFAEIQDKFEVLPATFKNLNDDIKLNIKLGDHTSPNDLLSFLTSKAEVHHFVEVIPSASDIFIQTIKNN